MEKWKADAKRIWQRERTLFLLLAAAGGLVYLGNIVQELPNPDALSENMYYKYGYSWEIQLGRFMTPVYTWILGFSFSPALSVVLAVLLVTAACVVIARLFSIRHTAAAFLAGCLVLFSPHVQSMMTYYYCTAAYAASYLLACISVYLTLRRDGKRSFFLAAFLLCVSLGGYQAYIGTYAGLGVMALILLLLSGTSLRKTGKKILRFLFGGALGVVLYLLANRAALLAFHTTNAAERGFDQMGKIDSAGLPARIREYCLHWYFEYFFGDSLLNNSAGFVPRRYLHAAFWALLLLVFLLVLFRSRAKAAGKVLSAVLFLLIPASCMVLFFAAPGISIEETTGSLMTPAFCLVWPFGLALAERVLPGRKVLFPALLLVSSLGVLLYAHMTLDGQSWMRYQKNRTLSIAQQASGDLLCAMKEAGTDTVCIAGKASLGNYPEGYTVLRDSVHWLVSSYGVLWDNYSGRQAALKSLFFGYTGVSYAPADAASYEKIIETQTFQEMPCYPEEGSIQVIDGIITLKMSEVTP
jgi:putative effector of murein hydrolase LrgA (UPF0299 family)